MNTAFSADDPIARTAATWFTRLRSEFVPETEREEWRRWLNLDPRHRAAYEHLERVWADCEEHASQPEITRRVANAASVEMPANRRWLQPGLAAAAVVLVAVMIAWWSPPTPVPETTFSTLVGEQRSFTLEDGSQITLDTASSVRARISSGQRWLFLDRGRAYFRVAKETRPFVVHTDAGSVRAVGTEFEVYRHPHATEVALIEGEVLLAPGVPDGRPAVRMEAGHRARLGSGSAVLPIEPLADAELPVWLTGRLMFDDQPLAAVIDEFNRYAPQQLVLGDGALETIRITGVFRSNDPRAFIGALRDAHGIVVDESVPGQVRLLRKAP